jgi:hypothetical protein
MKRSSWNLRIRAKSLSVRYLLKLRQHGVIADHWINAIRDVELIRDCWRRSGFH